MFDALKQYFDGCKDDVVVIHSHKFLNKDSNNEKDFIILNLTKGYILVIEVKANQSKYQKAKKQLFDAKDRFGEIFGALGYPAGWKYGGVFFAQFNESDKQLFDCDACSKFAIIGTENILDIKPTKIHDSTQLFLGANEYVTELKVCLKSSL